MLLRWFLMLRLGVRAVAFRFAEACPTAPGRVGGHEVSERKRPVGTPRDGFHLQKLSALSSQLSALSSQLSALSSQLSARSIRRDGTGRAVKHTRAIILRPVARRRRFTPEHFRTA